MTSLQAIFESLGGCLWVGAERDGHRQHVSGLRDAIALDDGVRGVQLRL